MAVGRPAPACLAVPLPPPRSIYYYHYYSVAAVGMDFFLGRSCRRRILVGSGMSFYRVVVSGGVIPLVDTLLSRP
jgi:hypothetical protein